MNYFLPLVCFCVTYAFLFTMNQINGSYRGYNFEAHNSHRLLLVRDPNTCYLIAASPQMQKAFDNKAASLVIRNAVIQKITNNVGVTNASVTDIKYDFHDYLADAKCRSRAIRRLQYVYQPPTPPPTMVSTHNSVSDAASGY